MPQSATFSADKDLDTARQYQRSGDYKRALSQYRKFLRRHGDHPDALHMCGICLLRLEENLAEAARLIRRAVVLQPANPSAFINLATILRKLGRLDEAQEACQQAIELAPNHGPAYRNLAGILYRQAAFAKAEAAIRRAIACAPQDSEAHFDLGCQLLASGRMEEGWREYEWRLRRPNGVPNPSLPKSWKGESLTGKVVALHWEQGLGDTIQFCRSALALAGIAKHVILIVQPALQALMKTITHRADITIVSDVGDAPPFDFSLFLMSAGLVLPPADLYGDGRAYLHSAPEAVEGWASRLPATGMRIGIAWQGNPTVSVDVGRSFPLTMFKGLAQVPNVHLISLQRNAGEEQLRYLPGVHRFPDLDTGQHAFLDTAAVMQGLDLVITSDTSIAHLAGALGRPVWVVLQKWPEWRWGLGTDTTPWYPSARLFRQDVAGCWDDVFTRIVAEVRTECATKK